ncbi:srg family chemoreceptor domain-containing protein [Ditylenchus destructor]|nr:srg family chemoreceptor domain-containing protein [Ditylenchus destructor]
MGSTISQASYPPFIFSLIIGIPSIFLYTIEALILIFNPKDFRSAFFRLFIARFISNFLNYFSSFFFAKLGRVGIFLDLFEVLPSKFLAFVFFFNYYNFHVENLSTMFILLNRVTMFIFPTTHNKIWKYLLPVALLITYIAPLPFTSPILIYDFYVRRQADNWTFTLDFRKEAGDTYVNSVYISAVSASAFCVICGALNLITVYLHRKSMQSQPHLKLDSAKRRNQKVESRLTIYAFVTFTAQFIMAIYSIFIYLAANTATRDHMFLAVANQFSWVNDLSTLVLPAWMLIWASSKVRYSLYSIFSVDQWVFVGRLVQMHSHVSVIKVTTRVQPMFKKKSYTIS